MAPQVSELLGLVNFDAFCDDRLNLDTHTYLSAYCGSWWRRHDTDRFTETCFRGDVGGGDYGSEEDEEPEQF